MTNQPPLKLSPNQSLPDHKHQEEYERDGHVVIPQLLSPKQVQKYRQKLLTVARQEHQKLNDYERSVGVSGNRFSFNMREIDPLVWQFIAEPKIAQVVAELLNSDRVRILHYNCIFKPSEGRRTPWHRDCFYTPLEAEKLITVWIPLVNLTAEMGLLTFASGSHRLGTRDFGDANQYSRDSLQRMLAARGLRLTTVGKMAVGDVSFHHSLTLHGAPVNHSHTTREVVSISYYADDARIQDPETFEFLPPHMLRSITYRQHFLREYFADLKPGDLAHSHDHPVVYERL